MKNKKSLIAVLAIASTLLTGLSANAAGFSVAADRTANLAIAGDTVNVTLTGVPAEQGVYVRLCQGTLAEVATARPAICFGQGSWVSTSATAISQGAGDATKPVALAVKAQFTSGTTAVDCTVQACGIHIRRDHMGGATDYSLDRFIPVTFGAAAAATTGASYQAGKVSFEVVGQNGKNLTFKYGTKTNVKKATSNDYKVTFSLTGSAETLQVSIKAASKTLFSKKLTLTK